MKNYDDKGDIELPSGTYDAFPGPEVQTFQNSNIGDS